MDALLDYLDDIEDIIENGKKNLMTPTRVSVEKQKIMDLLGDLRLNLPEDLRRAQYILDDHDRILADAERKAQEMLDIADNEAKSRVHSHEIFRRATEEAQRKIDEANKESNEIKMQARDYVDDKLKEAEEMLRNYAENLDEQHRKLEEWFNGMLGVIYANRQQLRGGTQ